MPQKASKCDKLLITSAVRESEWYEIPYQGDIDMTNPVKKNPFDFSEWSSLANTDPKAFEVRREQAIESVIQSMPDAKQERIRRLQWRIDQERRLPKSPMAA